MFELVSRRYQAKSTIITTNRPFAEWHQVFPAADGHLIVACGNDRQFAALCRVLDMTPDPRWATTSW